MKTILFSLLAIVIFSQQVEAFTYLGNEQTAKRIWNKNSLPVKWVLNENDSRDLTVDQIEEAMISSFNKWENVESSTMAFDYQGRSSHDVIANDGINLITFNTALEEDDYFSGMFGSTAIGVSFNKYDEETGEIIDCDIVFNENNYTFGVGDFVPGVVQLQNLATHEIGHLVGLSHTNIRGALMYWLYEGKEYLTADEVAGVSSLYPAESWDPETQSIGGKISRGYYNIPGLFVTAYAQSDKEDAIGAMTDENGEFKIIGLDPAENYYIKAEYIEPSSIGVNDPPYEMSYYTKFLANWYGDAASMEEATPIAVGQNIDIEMRAETKVAQFDYFDHGTWAVSPAGEGEIEYMAVRFPAETLPEKFDIYSMTFRNLDPGTVWPRIFLTRGDSTRPDMDNPIRVVEDIQGYEAAYSEVEWGKYRADNSTDLWVVFEVEVAECEPYQHSGPGISTEDLNNYNGNSYWTLDNGKTFERIEQHDMMVYLSVDKRAGGSVGPWMEISEDESHYFGLIQKGWTKYDTLYVTNNGDGYLQIYDIYTDSNEKFMGWMDVPIVAPGATEPLIVSYTSNEWGFQGDSLKILTNDPDQEKFGMRLSGGCSFPLVRFYVDSEWYGSPYHEYVDSLDFGVVEVGEKSKREIEIISDRFGMYAMVNNIASSSPLFYTEVDSVEIEYDTSYILEVMFEPQEAGRFRGTLSMNTDDLNYEFIEFKLVGTAVDGSVVEPVPCDFNGDGEIGIADVIALINFQLANPGNLEADFNGDGYSNVADALAMLVAQINGTCP